MGTKQTFEANGTVSSIDKYGRKAYCMWASSSVSRIAALAQSHLAISSQWAPSPC